MVHRLVSATLFRLGAVVTALPLTGITVTAGTINLTGICATPDGRGLLVVQSNTGMLFRVDPASGVAAPVGLGGASLLGGDGMLLDGQTLHVVRNRAHAVDVFSLNRGGTAGTLVATITGFAGPTAVASSGGGLYVVTTTSIVRTQLSS